MAQDASGSGHNSKMKDEQQFIELCHEYAGLEAANKANNERKADIRAVVKDQLGEDPDAFKDVYGYFKKKRHEREGYDESHKRMWDALNKADTGDMFSFLAKDKPVADSTKLAA